MSYLENLYKRWQRAESTYKRAQSAGWKPATIEDWKREAQYRKALFEEEQSRLLQADSKLHS